MILRVQAGGVVVGGALGAGPDILAFVEGGLGAVVKVLEFTEHVQ